jgi:hypothetical protein
MYSSLFFFLLFPIHCAGNREQTALVLVLVLYVICFIITMMSAWEKPYSPSGSVSGISLSGGIVLADDPTCHKSHGFDDNRMCQLIVFSHFTEVFCFMAYCVSEILETCL